MTIPNFFVVGAPKCGSTTLYNYLREHPSVYIPKLKEPRYFATDLGDFREITSLLEYEKLYKKIPDQAKAIGDCSPWYLCSPQALKGIRQYNRQAKIIAIIRNPIQALPSLHNQFVNSFKENETDLARAWDLQKERSRGYNLPPGSPAPRLLQYGEITKFGDQIEHMLTIFPPDKIKIILFDDLVRDPQKVYGETIEFLGLEDDCRKEFPAYNMRVSLKNKQIGWLFASPTSPIFRTIEYIRNKTGIRSTNILGSILDHNRRISAKKPISTKFHRMLVDYYRSDIQKLSNLIEKDLDHWLVSPDPHSEKT